MLAACGIIIYAKLPYYVLSAPSPMMTFKKCLNDGMDSVVQWQREVASGLHFLLTYISKNPDLLSRMRRGGG